MHEVITEGSDLNTGTNDWHFLIYWGLSFILITEDWQPSSGLGWTILRWTTTTEAIEDEYLTLLFHIPDGCLLFGQVPLVEIDGMLLTQTRAILSYLAAKYNLYGKDLKERVRYFSVPSKAKCLTKRLRSHSNLTWLYLSAGTKGREWGNRGEVCC